MNAEVNSVFFRGQPHTSIGCLLLQRLHDAPPRAWEAIADYHSRHLLGIAGGHLGHHLVLVPVDELARVMLRRQHHLYSACNRAAPVRLASAKSRVTCLVQPLLGVLDSTLGTPGRIELAATEPRLAKTRHPVLNA